MQEIQKKYLEQPELHLKLIQNNLDLLSRLISLTSQMTLKLYLYKTF